MRRSGGQIEAGVRQLHGVLSTHRHDPLGGVGTAGLHHLVWEILDNAVDEAMNGFASNIVVTLHKDGSSITVSDDGRGIPVDKHPTTKKSALEVIFTVLHAGGKFEHGTYKTAGGLHGVGASVVNALSTELRASVKRDGVLWEMAFRRGKPTGSLKKAGQARGTGTTVYFHPDPTIFPKVEFDSAIIRERLEDGQFDDCDLTLRDLERVTWRLALAAAVIIGGVVLVVRSVTG